MRGEFAVVEACLLETTASCAMLSRDVTAMLMKPVMGHSLRELAKFKIPLAGSVRTLFPLNCSDLPSY